MWLQENKTELNNCLKKWNFFCITDVAAHTIRLSAFPQPSILNQLLKTNVIHIKVALCSQHILVALQGSGRTQQWTRAVLNILFVCLMGNILLLRQSHEIFRTGPGIPLGSVIYVMISSLNVWHCWFGSSLFISFLPSGDHGFVSLIHHSYSVWFITSALNLYHLFLFIAFVFGVFPFF